MEATLELAGRPERALLQEWGRPVEIHIKKILCPTDFSEHSAHALLYALSFAKAYDAALEMLHVVQPLVYPAYMESPVQAPAVFVGTSLSTARMMDESLLRLEELASLNKQLHPHIAGRVVLGVPFVEIIRAAKEQQSDLIVMGTHGRTGLQRVLIGSVAEKVVRKAPCPVLTIKHPGHEFVMP